jgi:hypothetical protein
VPSLLHHGAIIGAALVGSRAEGWAGGQAEGPRGAPVKLGLAAQVVAGGAADKAWGKQCFATRNYCLGNYRVYLCGCKYYSTAV